MTALAKLAIFAATLGALFAGGALAGAAIGPQRDEQAAHNPSQPAHTQNQDRPKEAEVNRGHPTHPAEQTTEAEHPVRGLAVAENGLRVIVADSELGAGRTETLRLRIVDDLDRTVRDFDVAHEKRMHLIVVRRDLTGFQHLHPEQDPDGTWTTSLRLDEAGSYRMFADFTRDGEPFTLAGDLRVDGRADLRPLAAPQLTAVSDGGYGVRLTPASARPREEAELRFAITKDGTPVRTEPYLGAGGHLVALREGDLAFLHVHPTEHSAHEAAAAAHDDTVGFAATFPTAGRYRLFLQFRHAGRVHTVAFTQDVR